MPEFMRSIDERYQAISGLVDRRFYSIFYSGIIPSPILILGYNPGGNPESWNSTEYAVPLSFENCEHEYVDYDYPIAKAMSKFLVEAFDLDDRSRIRGLPKTNLIFRRSSSQDRLPTSERQALAEAQPFVEEIIARVEPSLILLEGISTFRRFLSLYCDDVTQNEGCATITTPNGKHRANLLLSATGLVRCLNRRTTLLGLGHPSRYGNRREWPKVVEETRKLNLKMGLRV